MKVDLQNTVVNEKFSLEKILSKLQAKAVDLKINKIQWPTNDEIFLFYSMNEFKNECHKLLNDLHISLVRQPRVIESNEEKLDLITSFHNDPVFGGHCGQKKLYAKLRSNFYWKGMTRDVANFIKKCEKCRLNKVKPSNREPLVITPTPQRPFDIIIIDTCGPLTTSQYNNKYAVTIMCDLTKYLIVAAIPNKEAKTVARAIFENFVLIYGPMKHMNSDLGTEYKNEILRELCELLKIKQSFSTAYRHQTVGTIERNHRVLNEYIRAYIAGCMEQWEDYIKYFAFCYNISYHSSLDHKYTPFELVFCKKVDLPYELLNKGIEPVYNMDNYVREAKFRLQCAHAHAQQLIQKAKLRNKEIFDKTAKPLILHPRDKVLIEKQPYNKHEPIYTGPYVVKTVEDQFSNVVVTDPNTNKEIKVHKNRVRRVN